MAFGTQPVDFNYFLRQKYAILQQQANAGSESAAAQTTNAATAAITGRAAAGLDTVRASLMPAESAAQVGLQGAQTALTRNQAQTVIPMANAQIAGLNATTAYTGTQDAVLRREGLLERGPGAVSIGGVSVPSGGLGFRFSEEPLSTTRPTRRRNETGVRYMDRTGWGL